MVWRVDRVTSWLAPVVNTTRLNGVWTVCHWLATRESLLSSLLNGTNVLPALRAERARACYTIELHEFYVSLIIFRCCVRIIKIIKSVSLYVSKWPNSIKFIGPIPLLVVTQDILVCAETQNVQWQKAVHTVMKNTVSIQYIYESECVSEWPEEEVY